MFGFFLGSSALLPARSNAGALQDLGRLLLGALEEPWLGLSVVIDADRDLRGCQRRTQYERHKQNPAEVEVHDLDLLSAGTATLLGNTDHATSKKIGRAGKSARMGGIDPGTLEEPRHG